MQVYVDNEKVPSNDEGHFSGRKTDPGRSAFDYADPISIIQMFPDASSGRGRSFAKVRIPPYQQR